GGWPRRGSCAPDARAPLHPGLHGEAKRRNSRPPPLPAFAMRHRSSLLGGGFLAVGLLFALGVRTGWIDLTPVVCLVVECPEEDGLDFQSLPEGVPAVAGTSAPTPADPPFTLLTQLNRQGGQFSISPAGQFIRESGVLTAAVNDLNEQLTLDRTVPIIVGRACGEVNAFYDPNQREIVFCDEMF